MRSLLQKLFRRDGRNLGLFVLVNTFACMFLFYGIEKIWGDDYRLVDCFYWTGVTIPTLGYGDILPTIDATKYLTVWLALSSLVSFGIGIALLGAHFIENPFEDEVNDDNDDCIVLLGLVIDGINELRSRAYGLPPIEIPDSVEELTGKPTNYTKELK